MAIYDDHQDNFGARRVAGNTRVTQGSGLRSITGGGASFQPITARELGATAQFGRGIDDLAPSAEGLGRVEAAEQVPGVITGPVDNVTRAMARAHTEQRIDEGNALREALRPELTTSTNEQLLRGLAAPQVRDTNSPLQVVDNATVGEVFQRQNEMRRAAEQAAPRPIVPASTTPAPASAVPAVPSRPAPGDPFGLNKPAETIQQYQDRIRREQQPRSALQGVQLAQAALPGALGQAQQRQTGRAARLQALEDEAVQGTPAPAAPGGTYQAPRSAPKPGPQKSSLFDRLFAQRRDPLQMAGISTTFGVRG